MGHALPSALEPPGSNHGAAYEGRGVIIHLTVFPRAHNVRELLAETHNLPPQTRISMLINLDFHGRQVEAVLSTIEAKSPADMYRFFRLVADRRAFRDNEAKRCTIFA